MAEQTVTDARTSFEQWATNDGEWPKAIERTLGGSYALMQIQSAWRAWEAAWNTRAADPVKVQLLEALNKAKEQMTSDAAEIIKNWFITCGPLDNIDAPSLAGVIVSIVLAHVREYCDADAAIIAAEKEGL